eukprot:gene21111-26302_t
MHKTSLVAITLVCAARRAAGGGGDFGAALPGDEAIMSDKGSNKGSCVGPIQSELQWGVSNTLANDIACHNRRGAEHFGYWLSDAPGFQAAIAAAKAAGVPLDFFDSVTGKLLFSAPRGQTVQANVRVLNDGETVSIDGTHLGHNIPDVPGVNRYCIDLVSVAGKPSVNATACPYGLAVYFGNGCFWHTQYDFYNVETDPNGPFNRSYKDATARTGYAGGKGEGANGQVCYVHGPPPSNPKSPEGTVYEEMAYAEAVQVMLDTDNEYAQFE